MAIRKIRLFGDPVLKTVCKPITKITPTVVSHIGDLLDTVNLEGRAGVASNQIGHTMRAFSLNIAGEITAVLNPEIVSLEGEQVLMGEGCLSLPNLWFEVARFPKVTVKGINVDGEELLITGEGLLAQALQHEYDHLDGKLYLDRLDRQTRGQAFKQIRASDWF